MTDPTPQDVENAERRAQIAARFKSQYDEALALAEQVLGPGWQPSGYSYLVEKDAEDEARRTNTKPVPSATVITAVKDGVKRHFRVETMTECETPEAGFGEMLMEPHHSKGFEHRGQWIPYHRYSFCWGCFEPDYRPQTAEQLAAAREKREQKAVEREAESAPLFAQLIRSEGFVPKRRER